MCSIDAMATLHASLASGVGCREALRGPTAGCCAGSLSQKRDPYMCGRCESRCDALRGPTAGCCAGSLSQERHLDVCPVRESL